MSDYSRFKRLYEAYCGCCISRAELRSREIDRQIAEDRVRLHRQINVLLLGTPGSGRNSFLRQASMLFGKDFDNNELNEFRPIIYGEILKGMKVLADARRNLSLEWQDPSNQQHAEKILNFKMPQYIDTDKFMGYFDSLKSLWLDKAIQNAYDRRGEFQLEEPSEYFLRHLHRVGQPEYLPSKLDAVYAKEAKGNGGVVKYELDMNGITMNMIHVSNQREVSYNLRDFIKGQQFAYFADITAITFLVSSNSYDQVCMYGIENCLEYSCHEYEGIVNFPQFANASFILIFTKTDLLEEKIKYSNIKDHFPEFQGDPQKMEDVQSFILQMFDNKRRERSVALYHHFTTLGDNEYFKFVFSAVKDTILQNCLKSLKTQ